MNTAPRQQPTDQQLAARHAQLVANGRPFGKATDFVAQELGVATLTVIRAVCSINGTPAQQAEALADEDECWLCDGHTDLRPQYLPEEHATHLVCGPCRNTDAPVPNHPWSSTD